MPALPRPARSGAIAAKPRAAIRQRQAVVRVDARHARIGEPDATVHRDRERHRARARRRRQVHARGRHRRPAVRVAGLIRDAILLHAARDRDAVADERGNRRGVEHRIDRAREDRSERGVRLRGRRVDLGGRVRARHDRRVGRPGEVGIDRARRIDVALAYRGVTVPSVGIDQVRGAAGRETTTPAKRMTALVCGTARDEQSLFARSRNRSVAVTNVSRRVQPSRRSGPSNSRPTPRDRPSLLGANLRIRNGRKANSLVVAGPVERVGDERQTRQPPRLDQGGAFVLGASRSTGQAERSRSRASTACATSERPDTLVQGHP